MRYGSRTRCPHARSWRTRKSLVRPTERAEHQDIRPMRFAVVNLMPTKIATRTRCSADREHPLQRGHPPDTAWAPRVEEPPPVLLEAFLRALRAGAGRAVRRAHNHRRAGGGDSVDEVVFGRNSSASGMEP